MKAKSFAGMNCSIAGAIEAVGDRWGFLILRDLTLGLSRYDAFQTSMGIPAQTLATRLKELENSGMVERRQYQNNPPRYEYALTAKGQDFWMVLTALREWGDRWDAHGADSAPLVLVDRKSNHKAKLALVDAETGNPLDSRLVKALPGPGADAAMTFRLGVKS